MEILKSILLSLIIFIICSVGLTLTLIIEILTNARQGLNGAVNKLKSYLLPKANK